MPQRNASESVIDAARFGALPDDGRDDTVAIARAIASAPADRPIRLVLRPGRYDLAEGANPGSPRTAIAFRDRQGLTIEGHGAELSLTGLVNTFVFERCAQVGVRDLTVDWKRPPFSVGEVVRSAERSFDVRVWDEFPVTGAETVGAFMDYDPATRRPRRHGLDVYDAVASVELTAPQTLRLRLKRPIRLQPGVLVVLRHQVYSYNAFLFARCKDVRVENVTVHTTPGMGLVADVTEDITLDRFRVVPRPGGRRIMSATADATHFSGCKGTVRLTRCEFEGMGDDAANVKSGLYLTVRERVDDRTVLAQHNLKFQNPPDPGDMMEIARQDTLLPYATARVEACSLEPEHAIHRLRFAEPLPAGLQVGDLLGNASRVPKLRMADCVVRHNRARGVLVQTRDAVIERCRFEGCTSSAVLVIAESAHFFESITARNVTIRNNRIEGCNYGAAMVDGAIQLCGLLRGFVYSRTPGVHQGIRITGNRIVQTDNAAVLVASSSDVRIDDNIIERACDMPTSEIGRQAIHVRSSRNVVIEGNAIDPAKQGTGYRQAIGIGPDVEEKTIRVRARER